VKSISALAFVNGISLYDTECRDKSITKAKRCSRISIGRPWEILLRADVEEADSGWTGCPETSIVEIGGVHTNERKSHVPVCRLNRRGSGLENVLGMQRTVLSIDRV
jgi:hypothetical protein